MVKYLPDLRVLVFWFCPASVFVSFRFGSIQLGSVWIGVCLCSFLFRFFVRTWHALPCFIPTVPERVVFLSVFFFPRSFLRRCCLCLFVLFFYLKSASIYRSFSVVAGYQIRIFFSFLPFALMYKSPLLLTWVPMLSPMVTVTATRCERGRDYLRDFPRSSLAQHLKLILPRMLLVVLKDDIDVGLDVEVVVELKLLLKIDF